jgi:hypothetical protein
VPEKRLKHCWYVETVVESFRAEFPYNEDLNSSKSQSKELIIEIEVEQRRQAIKRKGLAWVL